MASTEKLQWYTRFEKKNRRRDFRTISQFSQQFQEAGITLHQDGPLRLIGSGN